jgi:hypothetical protein
MKVNRYIKKCVLLTLTGGLLASCEVGAPHEEFMNLGEIIYVGKPEALEALPGENRNKLKWVLVSDPKIKKAKVFWNNPASPEGQSPVAGQRNPGPDSMVVDIVRTGENQPVELLIDRLQEGVYTFDVYTLDKDGNSSIKTEVIGEVYGQSYQGSIANRPLNSAVFNPATKEVTLNWFGVAQQAVVIEVAYTDEAGAEKVMAVTKVYPDPRKPGVFLDQTMLPAYKAGTAFKYRTGYLPVAAAIDTFYTGYTEVTDVYVNLALGKNVFKSSDGSSGRAPNAVDGDYITKWEPSSSDRSDKNTWITVDLGTALPFNEVDLYYTKDQAKVTGYEIWYSDDNATWKTAYTSSGSPQSVQNVRFPRITARYVRLSHTLQDTGSNVNLGELEVWNKK